jgi:acyl carrier protein
MDIPNDPHGQPVRQPQAQEIQDWLVVHLARLVKCSPEQMDVTASFDRLGLDSATAVGVTLDLEDWLGRTVEPTIFYDYPTIQRLAAQLARTGTAQALNAPTGTGAPAPSGDRADGSQKPPCR